MKKKEEGNFTRQPNLVGLTNISNTVSMNDTHTASEDLLSVCHSLAEAQSGHTNLLELTNLPNFML